jgi:phosphoribosylanthranilate isomerase
MALKTTVIINEITNLSDARYCAGMGVDFIGFRIDNGHHKYVDVANFNEITNWVAGIGLIGETSDNQGDKSTEYNIDQLLIDGIELLTGYDGQAALWVVSIADLQKNLPLLTNHQSNIKGIVLTGDDTSLTAEHRSNIKELATKFEVYLSFGIDADNVLTLIEELPIKGVALKGSDEIRPGYKDYNELADILEQLEEED